MLRIGNLRLLLPAGFEHRAPTLARLVAHALADAPSAKPFSAPALTVPEVEILQGASDAEVASRIAAAIRGALGHAAGAQEEDAC